MKCSVHRVSMWLRLSANLYQAFLNNREPYKILSNNCGTFVGDVLEAGDVNVPIIVDPRPNSMAEVWQSSADFSIEYDPGVDKLVVERTLFTVDKQEILDWKALPFWKRIMREKPH